MDKYKYKAFISYRHISFDSYVAEKTLELIESYKPPAEFRSNSKWEHWKCFRDEEELPLSKDLGDDIHKALERSEFLVVICSKDFNDSKWCREEIQYFKAIHGGSTDNIIAILINGDPETSFPCEITHSIENQTVRDIEPLAADIRADSVKESMSLLKTRYLKMAARFLNCDYDNLVRRENKRRRNRIISLFSTVTAVLVIIMGIILASYLQLQEKNEELLIENSRHLVEESRNLMKDGRPVEAIQAALKALPDEENDRPVLPEAEYCLAENINAFSTFDYTYGAVKMLEHKSPVNDIAYIKNGEQIFSYDISGLYFWDSYSGELLNKFEINLSYESMRVYIDRINGSDNNPEIYLYNKNFLALFDYEGLKYKWFREYDTITTFFFDNEKIIALRDDSNIEFIDKESGEIQKILNDKYGYFSDGIIVCDTEKYTIIQRDVYLYIYYKGKDGYDSVQSAEVFNDNKNSVIKTSYMDGLVFVQAANRGESYIQHTNIYCFDVNRMETLWVKEINNSAIYLSDTLVGWNLYNKNGKYFVAADTNKLYILNCENGETVKKCELEENITDIDFYDNGIIRFTAENDYSVNIYNTLEDEGLNIDYDSEIVMQSKADKICRMDNSCVTSEQNSNVVYIYEKRDNPDHKKTDFYEMTLDIGGNYALAVKRDSESKYLYKFSTDEIIAELPPDASFTVGGYVVYSDENGTVAYNYETNEYSFSVDAGFVQAGKSRCSYKTNGNTIMLKNEVGKLFSWMYQGDESDIIWAEFSPDGEKVMLTSHKGDPYTITVHSFKENTTLELRDAYIRGNVWVDSESILLWGKDNVFYEYDAVTGKLISQCNADELFKADLLMVVSIDTDNCVGVLCNDGLFCRVDMLQSAVTGEIDFKDVGENRISFGSDYNPKLSSVLYAESDILIMKKSFGTGCIDAWIIDTERFGLRYVVNFFREYAEGAETLICAYPTNEFYMYPLYTTDRLIEKAREYLSYNSG